MYDIIELKSWLSSFENGSLNAWQIRMRFLSSLSIHTLAHIDPLHHFTLYIPMKGSYCNGKLLSAFVIVVNLPTKRQRGIAEINHNNKAGLLLFCYGCSTTLGNIAWNLINNS